MKNKIIGIILTLVVIFTSFTLFSCEKNREYDEAEVVSCAKDLIKKSVILNDIFYGRGIPYVDDASTSLGKYYMADGLYLSLMGIETLSDIDKKTREVFSSSLADQIYTTKMQTVYDADGTIRGYSRYYQKYSILNPDEPECIMVNKDAETLLKDKVTYNYETVKATGSKGMTVFVEIEVFVETDDGKSQTKSLEIGLVEEENGWRISTPTYTRYVDLDRYNELQNKNK